MSSTATVAGTITAPVSTGGANASLIVGAPSITTSSSSGPTLSYNERVSNTYLVTAAGSPVAVNFGTLADASILYIGTDQAITLIFNGGAETFALAAGAFAMFYKATMSALSITAVALDATVEVLLLGD
jgi:hypothetical protein